MSTNLLKMIERCSNLSYSVQYTFDRTYVIPLGIDPIILKFGYKSRSSRGAFDNLIYRISEIEAERKNDLDRYSPGWKDALVRNISEDLDRFSKWAVIKQARSVSKAKALQRKSDAERSIRTQNYLNLSKDDHE